MGIGQTACRILAKAAIAVIRPDIQEATGSVQLCAGQIAGVESAIHAVHDYFRQEGTEAALFVDASNAFNSLNYNGALRTVTSVMSVLLSPQSSSTPTGPQSIPL